MIIVLICLFLALLLAPPICFNGHDDDYLSPKKCLAIKGLFVFLVFCSHITGYLSFNDFILDNLYLRTIGLIGQLMVAMFFFFSGYGIFYSYTKNDNYIKSFLFSRFLPVWIGFAVCVSFFIIENLCFGIAFSTTDILLSFTGWSSIGNSGWFMFVTFVLYILFFICFRFIKKDNRLIGLIIFSVASVMVVVFLYFLKSSYWYNTLMCFALGMWYSFLKDKIDSVVLKNNTNYTVAIIVCLCLFVAFFFAQRFNELFYCFYSLSFCLCVVVVMMKINFKSVPLAFLGKHVFSIYILQRLVFRVGEYNNLNSNPYLFFVCTFAATVLVSILFDFVFKNAKTSISSFLKKKKAT